MLWRASRALKFRQMPTWSSCGPTVKADAEQIRKRIDALWGNRDALLSQIFRDGWKLEPPDPGWRTAIRIAWHVDTQHFDAFVDQSVVAAAPGMAVTKLSVRHKIDKRVTSHAHIAHLQKLSDLAPTPFDLGPAGCDELGEFSRLHVDYDRKVSRSYDRFLGKWNERVLEEDKKKLEGKGHKKLRLKTMKHLYDEYDRRYKPVQTAGQLTVADEQRLRGLYAEQREAREATTAPRAHPTGPLYVPLPTGPLHLPRPPMTVPFGFLLPGTAPPPPCCAPRQYDAALATAAPWQVAPVPRPVVGEKPDYRRDCKTCGRPKGAHMGRSPFGPRCTLPRARLEELL